MIEKNIVGVYPIGQQYPVFQYPGSSPRRLNAIQRTTETQDTASSQDLGVRNEDETEPWRDFSENLRQRRRQQQRDGQQSPRQRSFQPPEPEAVGPENAALSAGQEMANQMIEKRVRQLQMLTRPHPVHQPVPAWQKHLAQLHIRSESLYETPETLPEIYSQTALGTLRVADVMTRKIVCMHRDASLEQAAAICWQRRISGLPVVNSQRELVGLITLKDLLRQFLGTEPLSSEHWLARQKAPISQFMQSELITVDPDSSLQAASEQMSTQRIRRILVTRSKQLLGLFSSRDAVRILARIELQRGRI